LKSYQIHQMKPFVGIKHQLSVILTKKKINQIIRIKKLMDQIIKIKKLTDYLKNKSFEPSSFMFACNLLSCLQQKWVVLIFHIHVKKTKEEKKRGGESCVNIPWYYMLEPWWWRKKKKKEKGNMNQGHTNHFENRRGWLNLLVINTLKYLILLYLEYQGTN